MKKNTVTVRIYESDRNTLEDMKRLFRPRPDYADLIHDAIDELKKRSSKSADNELQFPLKETPIGEGRRAFAQEVAMLLEILESGHVTTAPGSIRRNLLSFLELVRRGKGEEWNDQILADFERTFRDFSVHAGRIQKIDSEDAGGSREASRGGKKAGA